MFRRIKHDLLQLLRLLKTGDFNKIKNALELRINRFIPGRHDLRAEIERYETEVQRVLTEVFDCDNQLREGTIRVAIIARGSTVMPKSSAFIRLIAPLTHPDIKDKVSIKLYPEETVLLEEAADVCVVQRTAFDSSFAAKRLINNLRKQGIKLVFDTDDAFSLIEKNHSQYQEQHKAAEVLNVIVDNADRIWLSTPHIASYYGYGGQQAVVPNTLDERVWQKARNRELPYTKSDSPIQMVFMGTASHDLDLDMLMPSLDELARKHPDSFHLTLVGVTDRRLERPWITQLAQPEFCTMYPNFVGWFLDQGKFELGLSPLIDSEFNRSKSDIKALDYLGSGALPVVSDLTPYKSEEIEPYTIKVPNYEAAWFDELSRIVTEPAEFRRQAKESVAAGQEYIWNRRSSAKAAQQLSDELEALISG